MAYILRILPLIVGWLLDFFTGDPSRGPHPVVWFGRTISFFERRLNHGAHRKLKGALVAAGLVLGVYVIVRLMMCLIWVYSPGIWIGMTVEALLIYYCLAGTTLVREVQAVFRACDVSLDAGRRQVARIVGRDTSSLSLREVRTAALETLAENLSDGVVAPLFWYALLGIPGMLAYKMVNTLDSMIGYRTERYRDFGCFAARMDDVANWLPARITSLLMVIASGRLSLIGFVMRFGHCHASPNSGYPEAALAGILNCRFGGTHTYFGETVYKPYIGENKRPLTYADLKTSVRICRTAEMLAIVGTTLVYSFIRTMLP